MSLCKKLDLLLPLRLRQTLSVIFGTVEMLFFGGIIYGFNALIPVLKKEGIYSQLCNGNFTEVPECADQSAMYGYAFITYMVTQMSLLFVAGFLVDRLGLRIVKFSASVLFSVGAVLFGLASSSKSWLIFPAGSFVCVGGMTGLICNFAFSRLFTKTSVLVLALITGSYDAASSVFAFFALAYDIGFSYKLTFFLLAGIGLAMNTFSSLFIATYRLSDMSSILYEKPTISSQSGDTDKNGDNPIQNLPTQDEHVSDILRSYYPTILTSLRSFPFILITIYFSFALVRFNFFLTQFSILTEYHFPGQPATQHHLTQILSFVLVGGILTGMACGYTIDCLRARIQPFLTSCLDIDARNSVFWLRLCPHAVNMLVVTITAAILSTLVFLPHVEVYYVNYIILVVMRGFIFSTISSFIMTAFPIEQFGTLYGISGSVAGVFSCIQYLLLSTSVNTANTISFFFVPIMGAVPVTIIVKGVLSWRKCRNYA